MAKKNVVCVAFRERPGVVIPKGFRIHKDNDCKARDKSKIY